MIDSFQCSEFSSNLLLLFYAMLKIKIAIALMCIVKSVSNFKSPRKPTSGHSHWCGKMSPQRPLEIFNKQTLFT